MAGRVGSNPADHLLAVYLFKSQSKAKEDNMEKRQQFNTNILPSIADKIRRLAAHENMEPGRYLETLVKKIKEKPDE